jgi:uncharacterized protein (DUF58 family)
MAESSAFLKPEVLARIVKLGLRAQRVVEGTISGLHRSPLHGVSVEFADYREYAPGDDLKRLDWRAYARSNRYYVKRFEEESNLRGTIILDASASMRYSSRGGAMTKFEYAATLAASLAALLIKQRDAAGLSLVDDKERAWLRPQATAAQLAKLIDVIERAKPDRTTELGSVMGEVCDKIKTRGMVIVISDLLCDLDPFYAALGKLQHNGHEIMILQVLDKDEIDMPFNDSVLFKDIEGDEQIFAEPWAFRKAYKAAMETFIREVAARCNYAGIDHLLMKTDDDLGLAMAHYLHGREQSAHAKRGGKLTSSGDAGVG